MMSSLFCCASIQPYRPKRLLHEAKFTTFISWAQFSRTAAPGTSNNEKIDLVELKPDFAVQLVQQVNYGRLESKRYFIPVDGKDDEFIEVLENDLIQANFQKLNS